MIKQIRNFNNGFTLVETLVAITVLLLAIAAPLSIAANALFSAYYARDQITAYYLAEEAIEYIKNSRDTTFLTDVFDSDSSGNNNWLLGLEDCIDSGIEFVGCYVDTTKQFDPYALNEGVQSCTANGQTDCPVLEHCESNVNNIDTGLWGYGSIACASTPVNSKFKRKVVITPQPNIAGLTEEALITVTITWPGNGLSSAEKIFTLSGSMFNWQRK